MALLTDQQLAELALEYESDPGTALTRSIERTVYVMIILLSMAIAAVGAVVLNRFVGWWL